jgi:hypothetical protein
MNAKIPKDAVLLIPKPEIENEPARYGVAPGYYNSKQLLELLDHHQHNANAIHFIADMLETGNPKDDGFAQLLRANHASPLALAKIIKAALPPT